MNAIVQLKSQAQREVPDPAMFSAALEACAEGLAIVEHGRVLYANPAFAQLFGYADRIQVNGRCLSDFIANDDLAAGADPSTTPAGLQATCADFRDSGADLQIITVRDATVQKRLEQALGEAQRMETLGRLVSGVAHDFNNLLTAITLYGDLLVTGLAQDRRLRHHAEEIRMAGQQGASLVRQLLALARPQVTQPCALSLNQVMSSMQGMLRRLIGENIHLAVSLAEDLDLVRMDPGQVQQIILNLALNARDAMPEGGQLKFETSNRGTMPEASRCPECVQLVVVDSGCGMDENTKSHLFEPFFTTKRQGKGNGLGLATAASIVRQAGGTIQVASQIGRGTRVTVTLPRADESLSSDGSAGPKPVARDPQIADPGPADPDLLDSSLLDPKQE